MSAEVRTIGEAPPTNLTSVWLCLAVRRHVRLQLPFTCEGLATVAAVVLLGMVLIAVLPESFLGGEDLATLVALVMIGMYKLDVLLQHRLVFKWRVT